MIEFEHLFEPAKPPSDLTALGFHGTGGDEHQALELARAVAPNAALLAVRGKSTEEGLNRYFRRIQEGVFDVEDVKRRASELAEWIQWARHAYAVRKLVGVGLSNGANIGLALLLDHPDSMDGLVALRGMTPFIADPLPRLNGKPVLMLSGEADPIVSHDDVNGLAAMLRASGADVQHEWLPVGHGLSRMDFDVAQTWLQKHF